MFKDKVTLISGGTHSDERGQIHFVNDFDMSIIKRLYFTEHFNTNVVRAWQAHIIEKRWFLCIEGSFVVKLVQLDDFNSPSENLTVKEYKLSVREPQVLYIPNGFANGFKAEEENSKLMIFSDFSFGENADDQLRFSKNKWTQWED